MFLLLGFILIFSFYFWIKSIRFFFICLTHSLAKQTKKKKCVKFIHVIKIFHTFSSLLPYFLSLFVNLYNPTNPVSCTSSVTIPFRHFIILSLSLFNAFNWFIFKFSYYYFVSSTTFSYLLPMQIILT